MSTKNFDPVVAELSQPGQSASLSPELLMLNKNRITSSRELPPMEFLFTLFDEPCFPKRELVAFTGRAKSGKTFVMSMLMALCATPEVLVFKRNTTDKLRVLWYDTEQSDNTTQDILVNRIIPLYQRATGSDAAFPEDQFDIFNVRNIDRANRIVYLLAAIDHYKPDLVILDGIRDLVGDINDGTVAQDMMELLMKTAQEHDCCLVCVLHQNKSGDSHDPRGWLGTELLNKAFDVFATEKLMPQRIFKLEQLYTRKYDIEQQFYFTVDDNGLPCTVTTPPVMPQPTAQSSDERPKLNETYVVHLTNGDWEIDVRLLFTDAFQGFDTLTGAALSYRAMELSHITSKKFYYACLEKAMQQQIMVKTKDGKNRIVYRLNIPTRSSEPQQQELWQNGDPF